MKKDESARVRNQIEVGEKNYDPEKRERTELEEQLEKTNELVNNQFYEGTIDQKMK